MENTSNMPNNIYLVIPSMTSKEVQKFGKNLGYGVTMGVFSAMFTVNLALGVLKAVRKHLDKKVSTAAESTEGTVVFNEEETTEE